MTVIRWNWSKRGLQVRSNCMHGL